MGNGFRCPAAGKGGMIFLPSPHGIVTCLAWGILAAVIFATVIAAGPACATMPQFNELETRRFVDPVSQKTAFVLARASAWLKAIARAENSLPSRRKVNWTDSGGQRLALAAQVYTASALQLAGSGWQEHSHGLPGKVQTSGHPDLVGVKLTMTPVADAGAAIDLALRNPEFLTMRLALVNETIRLVNIMESHWNDKSPAPGQTASQSGKSLPPEADSAARPGNAGENGQERDKPSVRSGNQVRQPIRSGQNWQLADWEKATARLEALWRVQTILDLSPDGWFTAPAALPILENAARACPEMPVLLLLLAEAQLQRDLPERSVATCTSVLGLAPAISRARYIRALAHWRLDQPALAETDLDAAINVGHGPKPQGEELARRLRARGALRQMRRNLQGMCADFLAACSLGDCDGYASARKKGQCLQ